MKLNVGHCYLSSGLGGWLDGRSFFAFPRRATIVGAQSLEHPA